MPAVVILGLPESRATLTQASNQLDQTFRKSLHAVNSRLTFEYQGVCLLVDVRIHGIALRLETSPTLFSPQAVDAGTLALLESVPWNAEDKVLDLGCGYGVMGIYAAKRLSPPQVFMIDKDPEAVACARRNAQLNGVDGVQIEVSDGFRDFRVTGFTKILCNPPYHTDFSVAKHFIEKGFNRLTLGGSLWMVTKREKWYRNKLASVFGGARVIERDTYYVFESNKRSQTYASQARKRS